MMQRSRKILIISDVEDIGQSIEKILGSGYEFFLSPADEPVFTIGGRTLPDVVVLDIADAALRAEISLTMRNDERVRSLNVVCLVNEGENDEKTESFVGDTYFTVQRSENFHEAAEKIKSIFDEINKEAENGSEDTNDDDMFTQAESCLNSMAYQLIKSISLLAEVKDPCFRGHSRRTASLAREIVKRMGGNDTEQLNIYCAALVHDIGMVAIPDYIVSKKGQLSEDEFNELRQHTIIGSKIFHSVNQIPEIKQAIRWHHERYDGTGYPCGCKDNRRSRCI